MEFKLIEVSLINLKEKLNGLELKTYIRELKETHQKEMPVVQQVFQQALNPMYHPACRMIERMSYKILLGKFVLKFTNLSF